MTKLICKFSMFVTLLQPLYLGKQHIYEFSEKCTELSGACTYLNGAYVFFERQ